MRLQSTSNQEVFRGELTIDHPSDIPGSVAIKRPDSNTFIALRDVIGMAPLYQLLEASPVEIATLNNAGITIAQDANDLQTWYQQWNGPK